MTVLNKNFLNNQDNYLRSYTLETLINQQAKIETNRAGEVSFTKKTNYSDENNSALKMVTKEVIDPKKEEVDEQEWNKRQQEEARGENAGVIAVTADNENLFPGPDDDDDDDDSLIPIEGDEEDDLDDDDDDIIPDPDADDDDLLADDDDDDLLADDEDDLLADDDDEDDEDDI